MVTTYDHWKQVPRNWSKWPWQYFQPEEMACRGTGKLVVEPRLLDYLDLFRLRLGGPVVVLSAYRTPYHNAFVGGAPFSYHIQAKAVDLSTRGQDRLLMERLAKEIGFMGFGYYRTFLHIDIRDTPAQWGKEKWDV